jgi:hypothetical protein
MEARVPLAGGALPAELRVAFQHSGYTLTTDAEDVRDLRGRNACLSRRAMEELQRREDLKRERLERERLGVPAVPQVSEPPCSPRDTAP